MLYISRHSGLFHWFVSDSDDDVESEITDAGSTVKDAAMAGVFIYGACEDDNPSVIKTDWLPYQDPRFLLPEQIDLEKKDMIRLVRYKTMITSIQFRPWILHRHVTLRLSDFGDYVADSIFDGCKVIGVGSSPLLTLILDDKLAYSDLAFRMRYNARGRGLKAFGVIFDIRELSSDAMAKVVYDCAYGTDGKQRIVDCVIDREDRKQAMKPF